jgi:hypothetical protein
LRRRRIRSTLALAMLASRERHPLRRVHMAMRIPVAIGGAALAALALSGVTSATPSSGSISTLIGRATYDEVIKVKRHDLLNQWKVDISAKPDLDIAVQTIDFPVNSNSGWHSHPGPVFISVIQGTMTFYESDDPNCEPTVRTAGQGFLDVGDHAHIARNESSLPARNVVTYFAPPGSTLRIDEPNPGNCAFRGL